MIEVFKTNVRTEEQARRLLRQLHAQFPGCEANFDLDDCDCILRVKCTFGIPDTGALTNLIWNLGFKAEVLGDEGPVVTRGRHWKKPMPF